MSKTTDEEYVEPEVAALLAATPGKTNAGRRGPISNVSLLQRRKEYLLAAGKQRKGFGSSLLALATIAVVLFFTYVSMTSHPYDLAKDVEGSWSAEGQGPVARAQLVDTTRDIEVVSRQPDLAPANTDAAPLLADVVIPAKLQSSNYSAFIQCDIGRYHVEGIVRAVPLQMNAVSLSWETVCMKTEAEVELKEVSSTAQGDGGPSSGTTIEEAPRVHRVKCSFLLNKRRLIASFFDGGAPVVFLLQRADSAALGGFAQFWETKGKYLLCMMFLVFFLKGMQMIVDPPRGRHSRLIGRRASRLGGQ